MDARAIPWSMGLTLVAAWHFNIRYRSSSIGWGNQPAWLIGFFTHFSLWLWRKAVRNRWWNHSCWCYLPFVWQDVSSINGSSLRHLSSRSSWQKQPVKLRHSGIYRQTMSLAVNTPQKTINTRQLIRITQPAMLMKVSETYWWKTVCSNKAGNRLRFSTNDIELSEAR